MGQKINEPGIVGQGEWTIYSSWTEDKWMVYTGTGKINELVTVGQREYMDSLYWDRR